MSSSQRQRCQGLGYWKMVLYIKEFCSGDLYQKELGAALAPSKKPYTYQTSGAW